jgi:hypothetical protein
MMVVGMPGLTDAQNRVHMGLWAMSGGPLLVGADLTGLSDATLATLTNAAVIAIDQDALGLQAVKVAEVGKGLEVWSKPLSKPGERAVLLLNRTSEAAQISVSRADLALLDSSAASVINIWSGKFGESLGPLAASYSVTVPANDALLLLVQGQEAKFSSYKPAARQPGRQITFTRIAATHPMARVQINYTNPGKATRFADLRVNGRIATRIAFPPTGNTAGAVTIQSLLDRADGKNKLEFSTSGDLGPVIQSISVQ